MDELHELSGQKHKVLLNQIDHCYARPWYKKLVPQQKYPNRLTRFLFLKNFPRHFLSKYPFAFEGKHDGTIDVGGPQDLVRVKTDIETDTDLGSNEEDSSEPTIDTSQWTQQMDRLYNKVLSILQGHHLATLIYHPQHSGNSIKMANLMEDTSLQLRHSFASIAGWDNQLLIWLNKVVVDSSFKSHSHLIPIYHEALQYLSLKMPALINKFYMPPTPATMPSEILLDPFNEELPPLKRLPSNPIILFVPSGPSRSNSTRIEYWKTLLSSLGQLININTPYKPDQTAPDLLQVIKISVRDKIKDLRKKKSNETRPLVLVGFNQGSLIAIHAALANSGQVCAIVCLGFPLLSIRGYRGDLDDPMLDMNIPVLFVIGQMACTAPLDWVERLRESMPRCDTGLVVVGGSNDKLIVRTQKKISDGITQAIVDRCIADEIYYFLNSVIDHGLSHYKE